MFRYVLDLDKRWLWRAVPIAALAASVLVVSAGRSVAQDEQRAGPPAFHEGGGPANEEFRPAPPTPPRQRNMDQPFGPPGPEGDWDQVGPPQGPQAGPPWMPPRDFEGRAFDRRRGPEDRMGPPPGAPGRELDRPRGPWGPQDQPMMPGASRGPRGPMGWDGSPPGPQAGPPWMPPQSFEGRDFDRRRGPEDRMGPPPGAPGRELDRPQGPWGPQNQPMFPGAPRGPRGPMGWDAPPLGPQAGPPWMPPRCFEGQAFDRRRGPEDRMGPPPGAPGRELDRPRGPWGPQNQPMMPPGAPRGPRGPMGWDGPPPGPQAGPPWLPPRGFEGQAFDRRRGPEDRMGPPPGVPGRELESAARTVGLARSADDASWCTSRAARADGLGRTATWSASRTAVAAATRF